MRLLVLALAMLAFAGKMALACQHFPQPRLPTATVTVETDTARHSITAELAMDEPQRACGLMGRPALGPDEGMLFDMRPPGPAFFWMDNTPEPLDMLFADADGIIVHIERNAVPFSQRMRGTRKPVAAVLELAGGAARRLGVTVGDRLDLPWAGSGQARGKRVSPRARPAH